MAVKIRLARGGAKKVPYYRIVVANATAPRDGDFLEKVGTYNPLLKENGVSKVVLVKERIVHWLSKGAKPTERVAKFIAAAGIELPTSVKQKMEVKSKALLAKAAAKAAADEAAAKVAAAEAAEAAKEAAKAAKEAEEAAKAAEVVAEEAAEVAAEATAAEEESKE